MPSRGSSVLMHMPCDTSQTQLFAVDEHVPGEPFCESEQSASAMHSCGVGTSAPVTATWRELHLPRLDHSTAMSDGACERFSGGSSRMPNTSAFSAVM